MELMDLGLWMTLLAFLAGGILKGAIGAGTPVVAIPVMALFHDVPYAVAVFVLPGFLSNASQAWSYRAHILPARFTLRLVAGAIAGVVVGSVMLATLPEDLLIGAVAGMTLAYVGFRLLRPDWVLPIETAQRVVLPVAGVSGVLQGAAGISAPVSVTFLNALGLSRSAFIGTISVFFISMSVAQGPALLGLGILTPDRLLISLLACVPLFVGMPIGERLGRTFGKKAFDRVIMLLLVVIALRLLAEIVLG